MDLFEYQAKQLFAEYGDPVPQGNSLIYGKMEIYIQKNMKADGMAVSTYIENGTADMTQQLIQLPCIESIGKE